MAHTNLFPVDGRIIGTGTERARAYAEDIPGLYQEALRTQDRNIWGTEPLYKSFGMNRQGGSEGAGEEYPAFGQGSVTINGKQYLRIGATPEYLRPFQTSPDQIFYDPKWGWLADPFVISSFGQSRKQSWFQSAMPFLGAMGMLALPLMAAGGAAGAGAGAVGAGEGVGANAYFAGAGAGTGTAAANITGLVQMGTAAGLSGAELEAFVASGGTLGSTAAGGGGVGLGATWESVARSPLARVGPAGVDYSAIDMGVGAPVGGVPTAAQAVAASAGRAATIPSWLQGAVGVGSGLLNMYNANQYKGSLEDVMSQLQAGFDRSDPFAGNRALAGAQYAEYLNNPEAYLSSPLARLQIDELNRAARTKQAQLGQTWNIDPSGNIRGSGTGAIDFARQLQFNLAKQYETVLGNRAQQAGMNLFPSAEIMRSMAGIPGMQNQASGQMAQGIGQLFGGAEKLFPAVKNWLGA